MSVGGTPKAGLSTPRGKRDPGLFEAKGHQLVVIEALHVQNVVVRMRQNLLSVLTVKHLCENPSLIEDSIEDDKLRVMILRHNGILKQISSVSGDHLKQDFKEKLLVFSLRNILRLLEVRPHILDAVQEKISLTEEQQKFLKCMNKVVTSSEERLLVSPYQQFQRNQYIEFVQEKAKKSHDHIVYLQRELDARRNEMNEQLSEKDNIMYFLHEEIEALKGERAKDLLKTMDDAEKKINDAVNANEAEEAKLRSEVLALRSKLQENADYHYQEETAIRKKKFKLMTELYNWVAQYDQDIGNMQDEIDEIKQEHNCDLQDLKSFEKVFTTMEGDYNTIMEERNAQEEAARKAAEEQARRNSAALYIQSFWKGFKVRTCAPEKKVNKKKGKGKKGKKGK